MHKRLGLSAFAALALTAAMTAQADVGPGFYAGVGLGTTEVSEESMPKGSALFFKQLRTDRVLRPI